MPNNYNNRVPAMYDLDALLRAGIDPKTGLPVKLGNPRHTDKVSIKRLLRKMDEQDAINMFKWYNFPTGITGQDFERFLYYKYTLGSVYLEDKEDFQDFWFLPYALDGGIDFYGRFNTIHPVPMSDGTTKEEQAMIERQRSMLANLKLKVQKFPLAEEPDENNIRFSSVIIKDYTPQSDINGGMPMAQLIDPILDQMADIICFLHTALKNSTGVMGLKVGNPDEQSNVLAANITVDNAALSGEKYVPIIGGMEFQDLTGGDVAKAEEYLMTLQALDNLRLGIHGIDNGGLFEKKAHTLQSEQEMNSGIASMVAQDKLTQRQNWCTIFNSIYKLGVWCEMGEPAIEADKDMDGEVVDNQDDSQIPMEDGGENDVA